MCRGFEPLARAGEEAAGTGIRFIEEEIRASMETL